MPTCCPFCNLLQPLGFACLLLWRWPRKPGINTSFAIGIIASIFFEGVQARLPDALIESDELVRNIPLILGAFACVLVASPDLFHRRLWLLLMFLVLLVVGNEIAKLGFSF
jgi:hypothetical protein